MIKTVNNNIALIKDNEGNNQRGIYLPSKQNENLFVVFETESDQYQKGMTVAVDKNQLVRVIVSGDEYFIAKEKDILAIIG